MIEIADNADAVRIGRPDRKVYATDAVNHFCVGAKFFVSVVVAPFAHEIQIKFRKQKRKSVCVVALDHFVVFRSKPNAIARRRRREFTDARQNRLKEPFGAKLAHHNWFRNVFVGQRFRGETAQQDFRLQRARLKKAHGPAASFSRIERMWPENAEGIGIMGDQERFQARAKLLCRGRLCRGRICVRHESILSEEWDGSKGLSREIAGKMRT